MIIVILLIVLILYLIYNNVTRCDNDNINDSNKFKYVKPEIIKQIYSMLKITDELLSKNNIEYWMSGGTMLGAVRHHGIIPWDDDGDIEVLDKYESDIESLSDEFKKNGLTLMKTWFGFKIFPINGKSIKNFKWKYPAIDIFIMTETDKDDIITFKYNRAKKQFGKCYSEKYKIYPLQKYEFGPLMLQGMSSKYAKTYLDRCYGNDWNEYAYREYDHETEKRVKKIKIKLTDNDRKPASF